MALRSLKARGTSLNYGLFPKMHPSNSRAKVSSTESEYSYRVVRVIQGVDIEHSPRKQLEDIAEIPHGTVQSGRYQRARPGSYAEIKGLALPSDQGGLGVSLYFQAHLPQAEHVQTIVSNLNPDEKVGLAVVINPQGTVAVWIGTGTSVEIINTSFTALRQRWVQLELCITGIECSVTLKQLSYIAEKTPAGFKDVFTFSSAAIPASSTDLLLGAAYAESPESLFSRPTNFFNGRIDSFSITATGNPGKVIAKYDFSANIPEDTILDVSGNDYHGSLINAPTRAVTGYDWNGSEADWTRAKSGYGAIHFHEDDLDDARWETDFHITLPAMARSGVYAVELTSSNGKTTDLVPFIVRPAPSTTKAVGAKVALVLSTFTYLAYANEKLGDPGRPSLVDVGPGFDANTAPKSEDFHRMIRRQDLGLSTYDVHRDGSGVVFSSAKRPILNFRTGYVMWAFDRPRELSAESMMIGFLERENIPYDVLTDHDLHVKGVDALIHYNTVMTGCHPEYPTLQSYDAYEQYARKGGNLMYLGGNGFYWVAGVDPARPWRLEIRRGDQGVRSYALPGGERFLSVNGMQGGLWRSRGRSSHGLFGVAFNAEGTGPGVPFKRTEASFKPELAWMFQGIPKGDLIGEFGLGGGASGDEIDSYDIACGSPANAVVVATSTGHPDSFGIGPECTMFPILKTLGSQTDEIRSDIVYYDTDAGGAVFSVGSINWFCSLGYDDYQNNVALLTGNVIREFLRRRAEANEA